MYKPEGPQGHEATLIKCIDQPDSHFYTYRYYYVAGAVGAAIIAIIVYKNWDPICDSMKIMYENWQNQDAQFFKINSLPVEAIERILETSQEYVFSNGKNRFSFMIPNVPFGWNWEPPIEIFRTKLIFVDARFYATFTKDEKFEWLMDWIYLMDDPADYLKSLGVN